jgi:predicted alpha-1,2-mannosidase
MKRISLLLLVTLSLQNLFAQKNPVDFVNPFIGTSNYGTTNPGAVCPNGLMSVVPFNVMGSDLNKFDKDKGWWSTPYESKNSYFTGYTHVNLSGVGCPDLSSLLLMPTTGDLEVDFHKYGSEYTHEKATPGYYSNFLSKYQIKTEVTATPRTGMSRFTFPKGQSHILLNLGWGLTNESGATVRFVNDNEIEGSKLLGTFCYSAQSVFPIYFVMRVNKKIQDKGYWKKDILAGAKAQWDSSAGKYKIYNKYSKEMSGDDLGAWFSFDTEADEAVTVSMGVSFVSIANARMNLEKEQTGKSFDDIHAAARQTWNEDLSRILVEGGTDDQKTVFYSALYHTLIHPNILQDVNGQYPAMESNEIRSTSGNRYTVYSLWDTYRNFHQLMTLVYPERQLGMIRTMLDMYRENGWLPKWELYGRETLTMEGDPAIPVIVDSWLKGLRDFDANLAYEAMYKSATTPGKDNLLRPDNDDYMNLGYVPLRKLYDNSVSHALEYYVADYALSKFAKALGKTEDAKLFRQRSLGYKHYYSTEFGTLRPKLPDGKFYTPFNPKQGVNFEQAPGFHEGSAWNYTFYVPHDVFGLVKLMGGKTNFVNKRQRTFDENLYDPTNEPDIAYPYLFSYFKDEAWRTQKEVSRLLEKYFQNKPSGLPGNDDTGTLSAWAVFSMMGLYPDCPGEPSYTLTTPVFDKITIKLQPQYFKSNQLIIETKSTGKFIKTIQSGDKKLDGFRISHDDLIHAGKLTFTLK